jgi:hypothetical protein
MVDDVTEMHEEYCTMMADLSVVGWEVFQRTVDQMLAVPIVRCPFGCSEFVPYCNVIPLDVLWMKYTERIVRTYSLPTAFCNAGFWLDLLDCEATILDRWKCKASVRKDKEGVPVVLLC